MNPGVRVCSVISVCMLFMRLVKWEWYDMSFSAVLVTGCSVTGLECEPLDITGNAHIATAR